MPSTPIYGLPFEATNDAPGHSLDGGLTGTDPILAEAVEAELARIDADVADVNEALATFLVLDSVGVSAPTSQIELTIPATATNVVGVRVVGVGRTNQAADRSTLVMQLNNFSATNAYRNQRLSWTGDSPTATASFTAADDQWNLGAVMAGDTAGTDEVGDIDILIPDVTAGFRRRCHSVGGVLPSTNAADAVYAVTQGRSTLTAAVTSIQIRASGDFVAGTVFELRRA